MHVGEEVRLPSGMSEFRKERGESLADVRGALADPCRSESWMRLVDDEDDGDR